MVTTAQQAPPTPPGLCELVPTYFETALLASPDDCPPPKPAVIQSLLASIREHGQLVPGFVYKSPDLPHDMRVVLEGNHRLAVARMLDRPFWAFDLEREVPPAERIKLSLQFNHSRRVLGRDEIADLAGRFMELTGCTAGDAAKHLNVSHPTLSRAFGERRIPAELRERADTLVMSVRSLVAAMPPALMGRAVEFAATPGPDGRLPTREQVTLFLGQLRLGDTPKPTRPAKPVTLRVDARTVTFTVADGDNAASVSKDLNAILARLAKLGDVPPEGWHFLFR